MLNKMKLKHLSLDEFYEQYGDEDKCRKYFLSLRYPDGMECDKCCHRHIYYLKSRDCYECANCKHHMSLTANTIMENTHLSYHTWLLAIYFLSHDQISVNKLSHKLGISYKATRLLCRKIKYAMHLRELNRSLDGEVEFDGFEIGRNKNYENRLINSSKTLANIAVKTEEISVNQEAKGYKRRKVKGVLMDIVPDLTFESDYSSATKMIIKGSTLLTDNKASYKKMSEYNLVNENSFPKMNPNHLKCLHIVISNFKSYVLGIHHGIAKPYMILTMSEFLWRINHRFCGKDLIDHLSKQIVKTKPRTCKQFVDYFKNEDKVFNYVGCTTC